LNTNVTIPPFAVDADEAARLCGISRSKWYSMKAAGQVPFPIRHGRRVVWIVDELKAWMHAGAPPGLRWRDMKPAA
jgi:predicted DNA-binding transcriptional regulator AlpA